MHGNTLIRLVDPATNTQYVLLRAEVYERLCSLVNAGFDVVGAYPAIDRAIANGWNDSKMDDYDRYEEIKR